VKIAFDLFPQPPAPPHRGHHSFYNIHFYSRRIKKIFKCPERGEV
jgi:hypothetical protein